MLNKYRYYIFTIVVCSRVATPNVASSILTPPKSESSWAGVGSESFGVVRSLSRSRPESDILGSESSGVGVIHSRSRPEFSGVVRGRLESSRVIRSRLELSGVDRSQPEPFFAMCLWSGISFRFVLLSFTLRMQCVYSSLFRRPTSDDSGRLRMTPDDYGSLWLQATPEDTRWLQTILRNSR